MPLDDTLIPDEETDTDTGVLVRPERRTRQAVAPMTQPRSRRTFELSDDAELQLKEMARSASPVQSAPADQAKPKPLGLMGTIKEGAKGTLRALGATADTMQGDAQGVVQAATDQANAPKDPDLERFYAHIDEQRKALGENPSLWEGIKAVGGAAIDNPRGFGLMVAEQLPNSGVALGAAGAGALAGSLAGPVGAVAGGLAGLAGANIGLETGVKALEAGADGSFTPEEQSRVRREGLTKGAVITGVDAATLGVTKFITNTSRRAVEHATIKTLADNGVDVTSAAARRAAMETPEIAEAVKSAQELAKKGAETLGKRLARTGGALALETIGEGAGEYLGELAATGKANALDAVIEGFAGLGTSIGEIAATSALNRKGLQRLFDSQEEAEKKAETETKETGVEHEVIPHPAEPDKFVAVPKVRSIAGIELERDATGNLKPVAPVSTQTDFNLANRPAFELTAEDKIRQRELERQREEELAKKPIITPTIAGKPVTQLPIEALNYTVSRGSTRSREIAAKELERRQKEGDTSIPEKPSDTVKRIVTTGAEKAQEDAKKPGAIVAPAATVKPAKAPKTTNPVTPEMKKPEKIKTPAKPAESQEKISAEKPQAGPGPAQKEPWQMTRTDWVSAPRKWEGEKRLMTLTEWRAANGYSNPLGDHGDFRHPNGISKATAKRINDRFQGRLKSAIDGAKAYEQALKNGNVPEIIEEHEIRADGLDTENALARARLHHKKQVRKALLAGQTVPEEVLAEYPDLAARQIKPTQTSPASAIRPHIESLIKRRAAASQTGKERSLNNAINRAKEVMDGKRTDTALESKWFRAQAATIRKADPETADILSRIGDTIKSAKQSEDNAGAASGDKEDQQQVVPKSNAKTQENKNNAGTKGSVKKEAPSEKPEEKAKPAVAVRGNQKPVPRGGRILANGIVETLQRQGVAALVGQKITSPERLAELAQVYRDPQYETFRIFFTKGNDIVHASGVTARLPGKTPIFPEGMGFQKGVEWIKSMMESSGADGYWMLHNHPSGNPTPSNADVNATNQIGAALPGLKGHVIINSNKYAHIRIGKQGTKAQVITKDFGADKLLQASKPHEYIGRKIPSQNEVVAIGKSFQKEGWVTLIGVSGVGGVRAIAEIPVKTFTTPGLARAAIRRFSRRTGSDSVFAYGTNADLEAGNADQLVRDGFLRDAVDEHGMPRIGRNRDKTFGLEPGTGGMEVRQGEAQTQTDTPAFKRWFSGSKVVDEDGKPLVVYRGEHGKDSERLQSRLGSLSFGSRETANLYAQRPNDRQDVAHSPRVYPVYLRIENPIINNQEDPFIDLSVIRDALGKSEAKRIALKFAGDIEYTGNWMDDLGNQYDSVADMLSKNPDALDKLYFDAFRYLDDAEEVEKLKKAGYDGAIHGGNGESALETEYKVFSENQVKSAIGNRGTFDDSPLLLNQNAAPFSTAKATVRARMDKITDSLIYNFQDRFKPLKDIQNRAGPVAEDEDAALAEERYSGIVRARMDSFEDQMRDPLLKAIHDSGVPYEDVEKYLHALHAPSRNAAMKEINPTEAELKAQTSALEKQRDSLSRDPDVGRFIQLRRELRQAEADIEDGIADESLARGLKADIAQIRKQQNVKDYAEALDKLKGLRLVKPFKGDNTALSGMSDKEAADILAKADKDGTRAKLDKVSAIVDAITQRTRQIYVESGLEKADAIDAWNRKYEHYVPLHRDEVGGNTMPKVGQGFNIRGKESKRATGSTKAVTDILAHVVAQHEAAIIRSEKARVDRALFQFASNHPDPSLWTLDNAPMIRTVDPVTGFVVEHVDPTYKNRPEVLTLKIDGEEHTITFAEGNQEAMRLAASMKNMTSEQMGEVTQMVSRVTRFLATMNTTANPVFVARNFLRDLQTAYVNLSDTAIAQKKAEVFRDIPAAIKGMWALSRGRGNSQWAKYAQEFKAAGGQTGWMDHYKDIGHRADALKKELAAMQPGKLNLARRTIKSWFEIVEDANNAVENGARLAAYVNARRSGLSEAKAAQLAKNLTVNFNARGAKSVELNAWYMFMNASIQGTARLIKAMNNRQVRKIVAGVILSGFLMDVLARAMAGDDDEDGENDYDQLPEHTKAMNFVLMVDGQPVTIPMPYGYNFFASAGRKVSEMIFRENYSPVKSAADLTGIFLDAFSPVGQAGSGLQFAAPTVADPFVQWAENTNFAGNPLRKEQSPFGVPKPEFQMGFKSTSAPAKWLAEALNIATGGNEVRPGFINVNPVFFDFTVSSIAGGAGRTYLQTVSAPLKVAGDDEIKAREIPFLNIFVGARPEYQTERKYFEAVHAVELAQKELTTYRQKGDMEMVRQIREEHGAELRLKESAEITRQLLSRLRKRDLALDKIDPPNKAELRREIEEKKREAMSRFNKKYREAVEAEG